MNKSADVEMSEEFRPAESTIQWLKTEYPNLDVERTISAFVEWAANATETNKRHPNYGKPLRCVNWSLKLRNVIRIQVINKWSSIAIPRQGHEVDTRWAEVLTHAKAIGCPLERRPSDTVDSFTTRIKMWEVSKPKNSVIDFAALKRM